MPCGPIRIWRVTISALFLRRGRTEWGCSTTSASSSLASSIWKLTSRIPSVESFAEPVNVYKGGKVKFEALLSNLDAMRAGQYPGAIRVVAPDGRQVFEEKINLDIPDLSSALDRLCPPYSRASCR